MDPIHVYVTELTRLTDVQVNAQGELVANIERYMGDDEWVEFGQLTCPKGAQLLITPREEA